MMCKKLTVTLKKHKGVLGLGNPSLAFDYNSLKITIVDCVSRVVSLESSNEIDTDIMFNVFCSINCLCMLGEGYFYNIDSLNFEDSASATKSELESFSKEQFDKKMLYYYKMNSDLYGDNLVLLPSRNYVDSNILDNWGMLDEELIYPNNAFRYMTHIGGLTIDLRTAYITECFEPLATYISQRIGENIPKINFRYENDDPTLFECLKYVVSKYGDECFSIENKFYETDCRLKQLVNNRVKLMHLKKNMGNKLLPTDTDNITYSRKLHLLYRHALLQMIGVDKNRYKTKLEKCVEHWDEYRN